MIANLEADGRLIAANAQGNTWLCAPTHLQNCCQLPITGRQVLCRLGEDHFWDAVFFNINADLDTSLFWTALGIGSVFARGLLRFPDQSRLHRIFVGKEFNLSSAALIRWEQDLMYRLQRKLVEKKQSTCFVSMLSPNSCKSPILLIRLYHSYHHVLCCCIVCVAVKLCYLYYKIWH